MIARSELMKFVNLVAGLVKDGECTQCLDDGFEPKTIMECPGHAPFDMTNDDAVDTLHSLISKARSLKEQT